MRIGRWRINPKHFQKLVADFGGLNVVSNSISLPYKDPIQKISITKG